MNYEDRLLQLSERDDPRAERMRLCNEADLFVLDSVEQVAALVSAARLVNAFLFKEGIYGHEGKALFDALANLDAVGGSE